ncbi:MAG TPA: AAA family ATPase [Thermoleophilaceae bacterium]
MTAEVPQLAGTEEHPHARMVLGSGLASGSPSHAYLFHGPPGTGKRTAARALAAELLAEGEEDREGARTRALHGTHPDLTWVRPTGAHVMRVSDVEGPVVGAAGRTPFESKRRVFVLERVDTMNDEVANRLLKTLEEPPEFVHLILLTDQLGRVLETVVSRCQLVRFDPLPAERIAELLEEEGVEPERARASARLSLGNASRARFLASGEGMALRGEVERLVFDGLGAIHMEEPWRGLLQRAEERREAAEADVEERKRERLEQEPRGRERSALEREFDDTAKRDGRRARTEILELGLELAALTFRDLVADSAGAHAAVLATDRIADLASAAEDRDPVRLRQAAEACEDTRSSLQLNVTEELALSALTFRLRELVGA